MPLAHDLTENEFDSLLQARDFAQLFNRLGWDNIPRGTPPAVLLTVPGPPPVSFTFGLVKEKHGFVVLHCAALPDAAQRRRLSLDMSKQYAEHLLIYAPDRAGAEQVWQLVVRDPGQPVRFFEFRVRAGQVPRDLWNRVEGLAISLADEEKGLTLTQVREKTRRAFALNAEKVTKKFYQEFSRQHQAFQGLIEGIESSTDRAWYTSIMLNRIMFIYFVQAQGYLLVDAAGPSGDDDKRYLKHKLDECAKLVGKDQFQSFYRDFLRVLFHEGLNAPLPHAPALTKLLGRVPYLNGGLFEEHQLEQSNPQLHIPDKAFEKLFTFLGQWNWILDSRQQATGTTINPDVLGYIFEQYINSLERKASGSYYTKEDITDYIAKNCLVPALFDRMAATVSHGDEVWNLLRDYPASYLYPAQQKGMSFPLPNDVEAARTNVPARTPLWNQPTPEPYRLPTELWRETIQRRDQAFAAQARLMSGQVQTINELITLNLDVRQFLHDAIRNAGSAEWVWACFEGLRSLSILDPTCGSGAFLFAALRLLEPLYEECLDRMLSFLPELENAKTLPVKRRVVEGMKRVRQELVENHQENRAYFITKTIILHNLYGVDLMHEAVEIAKLRLFLQLMSTIPAPEYKDKNMGLEPLPDVDFNIRTGNTLVGFATKRELDEYAKFDFEKVIPEIEKESEALAGTYDDFRKLQLSDKAEQAELRDAKKQVREAAKVVADKANGLLKVMDTQLSKKEFIERYSPFHWHIEFHGLIKEGGFDIIIGNPPYVEISPRTIKYKLTGYATISCGNLYALVTERANSILAKNGRLGFIVPSASCCTPRMEPLMRIFTQQFDATWLSLYDERPGKLFEGVDQQLCIQIASKKDRKKSLHITGMRHWQTPSVQLNERDHLFATTIYAPSVLGRRVAEVFPKISNSIEEKLLQKLADCKAVKISSLQMTSPLGTIYYRNAGGRYWRLVKSSPSYFQSNSGRASSSTELTLNISQKEVPTVVCLFSSSLFYWYWRAISNCRHLTSRELGSFPIPESLLTSEARKIMQKLATSYEKRIDETASRITTEGASGRVEQDEYHINKAKPIIDEIDRVLAVHYGLTDEELDFIINYDIKYRMGAELNAAN